VQCMSLCKLTCHLSGAQEQSGAAGMDVEAPQATAAAAAAAPADGAEKQGGGEAKMVTR